MQSLILSGGDLPGSYQLAQFHYHWGNEAVGERERVRQRERERERERERDRQTDIDRQTDRQKQRSNENDCKTQIKERTVGKVILTLLSERVQGFGTSDRGEAMGFGIAFSSLQNGIQRFDASVGFGEKRCHCRRRRHAKKTCS